MDLVSGCPFWPLKNGLLGIYPPLDADMSCEIAVVGGGISGSLTAHRLVEAGVDVLLLDRRDIASGSTAASTSLLQYDTDLPLHRLIARVGESAAVRSYRLGVDAIGELEKIARALKRPCDFTRRDSLYLARTAHDLRRIGPGNPQRWSFRETSGLGIIPVSSLR